MIIPKFIWHIYQLFVRVILQRQCKTKKSLSQTFLISSHTLVILTPALNHAEFWVLGNFP